MCKTVSPTSSRTNYIQLRSSATFYLNWSSHWKNAKKMQCGSYPIEHKTGVPEADRGANSSANSTLICRGTWLRSMLKPIFCFCTPNGHQSSLYYCSFRRNLGFDQKWSSNVLFWTFARRVFGIVLNSYGRSVNILANFHISIFCCY